MTKPTLLDVYSSEEAMCKAFFKDVMLSVMYGHLDENRIYHVPMGQKAGSSAKARMIAGSKDKAMGATAGVWDYTVQGVGYMEAKYYYEKDGKVKKTYLSPSQKNFRDNTLAFWPDCKFEVFRTPQEGMAILKEWGVIR